MFLHLHRRHHRHLTRSAHPTVADREIHLTLVRRSVVVCYHHCRASAVPRKVRCAPSYNFLLLAFLRCLVSCCPHHVVPFHALFTLPTLIPFIPALNPRPWHPCSLLFPSLALSLSQCTVRCRRARRPTRNTRRRLPCYPLLHRQGVFRPLQPVGCDRLTGRAYLHERRLLAVFPSVPSRRF